jgi:hypothetical protein
MPRLGPRHRLVTTAPLLAALAGTVSAQEKDPGLPTAGEMAKAREDVWGEAAIRQPGGPSFEFYKDLLPPLRYVNTLFRHYPIVLSAPGAAVKARWVSNGSALNARADKPPMWREVGTPVRFLVGEPPEPFGDDPGRLDGPRYESGSLPIVRASYRAGPTRVDHEAFAAVREPLLEHGAVLLKFAAVGPPAAVAARVEHDRPLLAEKGSLRDDRGILALFDAAWEWDPSRKELRARVREGTPAVLAVLTTPMAGDAPAVDGGRYEEDRAACAETWRELLARGAGFDIPEDLVDRAWKALVVGNFAIAVGDRMHYSAGNAYDHLYEGECGDATRSLLLFGHTDAARRMVGPLLEFDRKDTRFHVAGHKLQLLAHYYWVTRDAAYLREKEPVWGPVIAFVRSSRGQTDNGLLPPDRYAGDIATNVVSLNSNANCWRGLRDMAAVLDDLGRPDAAAELRREAEGFRKVILDAVAKSERRDVEPPFVPNALFGAEGPHDPLTATRTGSYYDLMAPYIIGSEVFGPGGERETWMIDYLRRHGGLAMGMVRTTPHQGQFNGEPGVNVLYGLRYNLAVLRRDDRAHALAGFYGQLAQGMTRDTFVGGEGSRFFHGDRLGRSFYLPPNSASNAAFLTTLRHLLVQDWDLDDDGRPDTLRLLYGAPGRWLADGQTLRVTRAPSAFGPVSFTAESRLDAGEVVVRVAPPGRRPDHFLLRPPLPPGWSVASADVAGAALTTGPDGSVDLSGRAEPLSVRFRVRRAGP